MHRGRLVNTISWVSSAGQVHTDMMVPQTMEAWVHIRGVPCVLLSFRGGFLTLAGGRSQCFHPGLDTGVFAAQVQ